MVVLVQKKKRLFVLCVESESVGKTTDSGSREATRCTEIVSESPGGA